MNHFQFKTNNKFRLVLFRITCLVLACAFMPDLVWGAGQDLQPDQIENPTSESGGEETEKGASEEEPEDSADSILSYLKSPFSATLPVSAVEWQTGPESIMDQVIEIHLPPPRA